MAKIFNTVGYCEPKLHYMVDLAGRLSAIKHMVDAGMYFTINRARQFKVLKSWCARSEKKIVLFHTSFGVQNSAGSVPVR